MENTKSTGMSFIKRLYKSIIDFEIFGIFIEEPFKRAIKYLAILVLIYSTLVTAIYVARVKKEISTGVEYLDSNIDEIEISNGILKYNNNEESIYINDNNIVPIIIVNTSDEPNIEEYKSKIKLYNFGFIMLKDKILVNSPGVDELEPINYSELNIDDMTKDEIIAPLKGISLYIVMAISIFIVEFIGYFIYTLFLAIILAIVGQIVALVLRLKMSLKSTYIIGIYALTLPTVLNILYILINSLTGFVIQYFNWMYTTISYIYVCVAILMIKTDFINLRREMMRIKLEEDKMEKTNEIENKEENDEEDEKEKPKDDDEKNNELKEQTDT